MRDRLTFLWNLKRSADRRVRLAWHLTAAALILILVGQPGLRSLCFALAVTLSLLLCLVGAVWGIFYPRAVRPARRSVWRWAAGATVVTMLAGYAGALDMTTNSLVMSLPTAGVLTLVLAILPFLFGLMLLYSWLGAAVSAYAIRKQPDRERLTGVGVTVWWLLSVAYLLAVGVSLQIAATHEATDVTFVDMLWGLIPLLTVLACALARNPEWELRRLTERFLHSLSQFMIYRRRWRRGRVFTLDLRGGLLGLLVAVFVFGLSRPLLKAPSATLLVWMIQVRNQEARGAWNGPRQKEQVSIFGSELKTQDEGILALRRKIVLIDLDLPVLRAAFAPSTASSSQPPKDAFDLPSIHSEAALEALLIRRLRELRATAIVLIPPQEQMPSPLDSKEDIASAKSTEAGRQRSRQDEKLLAGAMKEAGNVFLALPKGDFLDPGTPTYSALQGAAVQVGNELLASYGSIRLPVLESGGKGGRASLPIEIAQFYAVRAHLSGNYAFKRGALIPVDFRNAKPGRDFLHVPASNLLLPEKTDAPTSNLILTPRGEWQSLEESIAGRIVFLDTSAQHLRETPVGSLPARETLAYGTATVLAHDSGLRVSTRRSLLIALFIGMITGIVCAHKTPFEAVGRVILMAASILILSLACYMIRTLWLDAVVPLVTIVLTYLLVTQLAFTQQREKDRALLKRFVAPEFVDAMLDHPSGHLGLEGKLSHVCVLFADVRNFTGFAERNRPEDVFAAVNEYMTALTNALHAYGGVLDKYTGDGLMAWFPAEANSRSQIEKAVRGTLAMRDAAHEISHLRVAQGKTALNFGIGMHYGEAMIGLVGNEEHQINYTALGHAVIVSARLQTLAAGGEVIISETVHAALDATFQVEARDPVAVKGIYEPVRSYLVLSA